MNSADELSNLRLKDCEANVVSMFEEVMRASAAALNGRTGKEMQRIVSATARIEKAVQRAAALTDKLSKRVAALEDERGASDEPVA